MDNYDEQIIPKVNKQFENNNWSRAIDIFWKNKIVRGLTRFVKCKQDWLECCIDKIIRRLN